MKLFSASASPYGRKVKALIHKAGRAGEVEVIAAVTTPTAPDAALAAANPLGKIPCLVLETGAALYDSRVIARYLDARFGAGLYPAGEAVWTTLTLEALTDGMLDAALLCVYEARLRAEPVRSADWLAGQRGKIARGLDALEGAWSGHLAGPIDMGVIGAGCVLGYLDFRRELGGWGDWREGRPRLAAWGAAFAAHPFMQATAPF